MRVARSPSTTGQQLRWPRIRRTLRTRPALAQALRVTQGLGRIVDACLAHHPTVRAVPPKGVPLTALSLVEKGYFPRELPPPFSTAKLVNLLVRDPTALPRDGARTQCVRHNLARPGGFRRPLQVPNPRSFVPLADEFEAQWPAIRKHIRANNFSISRPVVTRTLERAVRPRFRLGERERLRPRDWRGQRFVLRTDVNQFYSSLYTHSIPWALEGKQKAKRNIGKTPSDGLDKGIRNLSDGQTMGVPIGPDTSFLAAEIVLTAVDKSLASKLSLRGHRYLDDYELAFTTRAAAEEAQALLEDALAEYELAINPTKTETSSCLNRFTKAGRMSWRPFRFDRARLHTRSPTS
jgi:hypothetical protein